MTEVDLDSVSAALPRDPYAHHVGQLRKSGQDVLFRRARLIQGGGIHGYGAVNNSGGGRPRIAFRANRRSPQYNLR